MRHVVDSCIIGPLIFPDEAADLYPPLLDLLERGEIVVPMHWRVEIAHFSTKGVRAKRIGKDRMTAAISLLGAYRVIEDNQTSRHIWGRSLDLGIKHNITLYDAPYLELALRLGLPLVTRDGGLSKAALREGVETIIP